MALVFYQELTGLMLIHVVMHREASKAAEEHHRAPREATFKIVLDFLPRSSPRWPALRPQSKHPDH
jgi:hypothetical protein